MRQQILAPGRNCWRIEVARQAAVLIDSANYFAQLEASLSQAQRSILIIGWDFDGRIRLRADDPACVPLGDMLRSLVEARPDLHVRILVWSVAVVHAAGAPMPLLVGAPWQDHPRISLRLDKHHPIYGAHHQKIVCIDDEVAFVGGIDLTIERWDTCAHGANDPTRINPEGLSYHPVHDIQMVVTGNSARSVFAVACARWSTATGEEIPSAQSGRALWLDDIEPDFVETPVAVARTAPQWGHSSAVNEIAALTTDALLAARHCIYIEAQYFSARRVRTVLARSLAARDGPEVVIVLARSTRGLMERLVMGHNRDRLIRRLKRVDRYDRLRVYYPVVPKPEGDCDVYVHSKLIIVDNDFLRIGSANLNNRSMGLDTECDLAIEADTETTRAAIARIRDRLLAEHIDITPGDVAAATAEGSLIRAIERLNCNSRCLRPYPVDPSGPTRWAFGTRLFDPSRPFEPLWFLRRKRPRRR